VSEVIRERAESPSARLDSPAVRLRVDAGASNAPLRQSELEDRMVVIAPDYVPVQRHHVGDARKPVTATSNSTKTRTTSVGLVYICKDAVKWENDAAHGSPPGSTRRVGSPRDHRSSARWLPLPAAERPMTRPGRSSRFGTSKAASRLSDTTAAVARGAVGATVKGVIGGVRGTAKGIRDGWRKGSQSVAGRPGEAWVMGVIGGIRGTVNGTHDGWIAGSQSRSRRPPR
jgi:hypothetical protein